MDINPKRIKCTRERDEIWKIMIGENRFTSTVPRNMKRDRQPNQYTANITKQINSNMPLNEDITTSKQSNATGSKLSSTTASKQSNTTTKQSNGIELSAVETSVADPISLPQAVVPQLPEQTQSEIPRVEQSVQDQVSSRVSNRDDDSYFIPHHSMSSAPRMIQGEHSHAPTDNAFNRLRHMGTTEDTTEKLPSLPPPGELGENTYPCVKSSKKKVKRYPQNKQYRLTCCLCGWTTMFMILLASCALATLTYAIIKREEKCIHITVSIIIMNIFAIIIIALEWIKMWVWREPSSSKTKKLRNKILGEDGESNMLPPIGTHPTVMPDAMIGYSYPTKPLSDDEAGGFSTMGLQQHSYDVPQFISALCLLGLYTIAVGCVCLNIVISLYKLKECYTLAPFALGFSVILAILIVVRILMCCLSDTCYGLCHQTAMVAASKQEAVPIVSTNHLHQALPGLRRQLHIEGDGRTTNAQPTAWLISLAAATDPSQTLSIVQPMPAKFSNDLTT